MSRWLVAVGTPEAAVVTEMRSRAARAEGFLSAVLDVLSEWVEQDEHLRGDLYDELEPILGGSEWWTYDDTT